MSVWRLHVHTRDYGVGQYCLAHDVVAMGWSFEDLLEDKNSDPELAELKARIANIGDSWENFVSCAEDEGYDFDSLIKLHDEVKPGDSIWMYFNGCYYLARVNEESKWTFCKDARADHVANQYSCIKWHRVASKNDLIPPELESAFSSDEEEFTFRRILSYNVEIFSDWLLRAFEPASDSDEPANIWRLLTHTDTEMDGGDISEYCLKNNVAAMGWSFVRLEEKKDPDLFKSVREIKSWKDFEECSIAFYDEVNASPRRLCKEVNPGDVIWMRYDGCYYFGRVEKDSKWIFNKTPDALKRDASNQLTKIFWKKTEDSASVPEAMERQFRFLGATFRRVWKPEIWEFTFEQLRRLEK